MVDTELRETPEQVHKRQEAAEKLKGLMGDFDSTMKSLHEDEESDALAKDARSKLHGHKRRKYKAIIFHLILLAHFHSLLT